MSTYSQKLMKKLFNLVENWARKQLVQLFLILLRLQPLFHCTLGHNLSLKSLQEKFLELHKGLIFFTSNFIREVCYLKKKTSQKKVQINSNIFTSIIFYFNICSRLCLYQFYTEKYQFNNNIFCLWRFLWQIWVLVLILLKGNVYGS